MRGADPFKDGLIRRLKMGRERIEEQEQAFDLVSPRYDWESSRKVARR